MTSSFRRCAAAWLVLGAVLAPAAAAAAAAAVGGAALVAVGAGAATAVVQLVGWRMLLGPLIEGIEHLTDSAGHLADPDPPPSPAGPTDPRSPAGCALAPLEHHLDRLALQASADTTQLARLENRLQHLADEDALTGLASRQTAVDALEAALTGTGPTATRSTGTDPVPTRPTDTSGPAGTGETGQVGTDTSGSGRTGGARRPVSVTLVDIDRFHLVNDTFGQRSADEVLRQVARRLLDVVAEHPTGATPSSTADRVIDAPVDPIVGPPADQIDQARPVDVTVARWGGDEFLLVLPGFDADGAAAVTGAVAAALARPVPVGDHDVTLAVTAATATATADITADRLLKQVDHRLSTARETVVIDGWTGPADVGPTLPGPVAVLTRRPADDDRTRHELVRDALTENRLEVWFQPIFAITNDEHVRPTGAEALVRIRTRDGEVLSPAEFLPGVDRSDLGRKLDERVAAISLDLLHQWNQNGLIEPGFRLALNVCEASASDVNFATFLADQMRRFRVDPERIIIELPESAAEIDRTVVERMKQLGLTVAIDDFGLSSSNLDRAEDFRAEIVKLDRRWVGPSDRPIDERERDLLRALLDLCSILGVHVVAEGIENIDQLLMLLDLGVSEIQGYFLSKPLTAVDFATLVARYRDRALVVD